MQQLTIEWIQAQLQVGAYKLSRHADDERVNENLWIAELKEALLNGRVLEHYSDTGRGPSCLVVGFTEAGKPLHLVCGRRSDELIVITVYVPMPPKFMSPYERGGRE